MRWWWLGLLISLGACERPCGPTTCSGCCVNSVCVEGTTRLECGRDGEACSRCTSDERCVDQRCDALPVADAGVVDAGPQPCGCLSSCCYPDGTCAPNNSIDACGARGAFCGTCAQDQRCEAGVCVAASCGGCFDPLGRCRQGNELDACGSDGGVCLACGVDQACSANRCVFTRCEQSNCRFGCCLPDKRCVQPTPETCGIAGSDCFACMAGQQCLAGTCSN